MALFKAETSLTTSSGEVTGNTLPIIGGLCRQVLIFSASTTTTYDVSLIDEKDRTVRKWQDITYFINDLATFPVEGIYTVEIKNASADEAFSIFLGVQELR